jgi:hypothetical protein
VKSLAIVPFKALEGGDDVGGRLVSERLALRLSGGKDLEVLDGRQLETPGRGRTRAPDGPLDAVLEVDLLEEVLRQFDILDTDLPDTAEERTRRDHARGRLKSRHLEATKGAVRAESRKAEEPPEAQALVTGFIVELTNGRVEVHARLAESEQFNVLASVSATVERDWGKPAPPLSRRDFVAPAGFGGAAAVVLWLLLRAGSA